MATKVPSEYARGRKRDYWLNGYDYGKEVAADWLHQGVLDEIEQGKDLGEIVGEWLESYRQYADTIYYDDKVTEDQTEAWEDGVFSGIRAGLTPHAEKHGISLD